MNTPLSPQDHTEPQPIRLSVEPLTPHAFHPFGEVISMASSARRNHVSAAFDRSSEATEPRLWVATVAQAVQLPLDLKTMERHPFSTQTFLPVNGCGYIVVVCQADAEGLPDVATLRAFEAAPDQGVTYARNVWHHGLSALQAPAKFAVCMSFTANGGDDVFVPLSAPVQLAANGVDHG